MQPQIDTTKLTRLPADFRYHASDLKKPCNMPMLFRARYPDLHPPGTLKTIGGTAGHKVMEQWLLAGGSTELTDETVQDLWVAQLYIAADADAEKSGRRLADDALQNYAAESAIDYGNQILGFMRWWIAGKWTLIAVECEYELVIQGGSKDTAPYLVEGRIDLIAKSPTMGIGLKDWKFGKMEKQRTADQGVLDMHYQLATYNLGILQGVVRRHDGTVLEGVVPDFVGLILMDDFLPYEKKTTISFPAYCTDAKRDWLEERRQVALGRAKETEAELEEVLKSRECEALAYPNNKAKQASWETAKRKLEEHRVSPVLYHYPGDLRGPGLHFTAFSDVTVEAHRLEMRGRMASTRMGNGLYRVRTEGCAFCFWRNVCLKDWKGEEIDANDPGIWASMADDLGISNGGE